MERDIVLILEGGTMLGVYGAGVVTALEEADWYHRIYSIYSVSAGAHNAAYFLAQQTRLGSRIYYEDLVSDAFIQKKNFIPFVKRGLTQRWHPYRELLPVVDLDYLEYVERNEKALDIDKLRQQQIPWYVRVFNVDSLDWEYLDGTIDPIMTMKASAALMPLYPRPVGVSGKQYIDGSLIRSRDFLRIIEQHHDKRILYVRNVPQSFLRTAAQIPPRLFDTLYTGLIWSWALAWKKMRQTFAMTHRREIERYPHVTLLQNTLPYSSNETRSEALQEVYARGISDMRQAIPLLAH